MKLPLSNNSVCLLKILCVLLAYHNGMVEQHHQKNFDNFVTNEWVSSIITWISYTIKRKILLLCENTFDWINNREHLNGNCIENWICYKKCFKLNEQSLECFMWRCVFKYSCMLICPSRGDCLSSVKQYVKSIPLARSYC